MGAKLLVVEDEQALSELLAYNLEAEGYEVRTAESAEDAELLVAEETPDLVILDFSPITSAQNHRIPWHPLPPSGDERNPVNFTLRH